MKIVLTQEKLAKALAYVSKAVSNKPNIPVLSNILLDVTKDQLRLSATNLDMGINMWIGGRVDEEGKLTVSGKFLTDFVTATGAGKIELEQADEKLVVSSERSTADFQTIPAAEFPILPKPSGESFFQVSASDLVSALEKVTFATSTDYATSKIQYTGVLMEFNEDEKDLLTMVGLDGFRMSQKKMNISRKDAKSESLIVPARSLQELAKIIAGEDDVEMVDAYLSESKSQIIFKFAEIEVSIRLLEGPYPDYKRVVPTEFAFSFDVAKSEFERALKIVNTFARSVQGNRVDFDLDLESGNLTIRSSVSELGVNEVTLEVENASGSSDLKDAYSLQFLSDMTNHLSGDKVHFETNAPLAAAVFRDEADPEYLHIVMPLQRTD